MNLGFERQPAGLDEFVIRQQAGFKDDFHRAFLGGFHHVAQLADNVAMIAVLEAANVHDHVDLRGAVRDRQVLRAV